MIELPKQNWKWYEDRCRREHVAWLRGLTPAEALALYEDFYRLAAGQQDGSPGWKRLEESRWEEKLALRRRIRAVLERLDKIQRERRHTQDTN